MVAVGMTVYNCTVVDKKLVKLKGESVWDKLRKTLPKEQHALVEEVVLGYQVPDTPKALEDSMLTSISATFEAAYANNPKRVLGSSPDDFEPHKSPKSDVAV